MLDNIPYEEEGIGAKCIYCDCYVWCDRTGEWNPTEYYTQF